MLRERASRPIDELVTLMHQKLAQNEHKGHWINPDESIFRLYGRLLDEEKELSLAFADWVMNPTLENWKAVELEMGDVANFMMMMLDTARTLDHPELRRIN